MTRGILRPVACFAASLVTIAVALGPPLHRAAEELFSGHMVQHLLLVGVAAPLLVAGFPGPAFLRLLPGNARLRTGRWLRRMRRRLPWGRLGTFAAVAAWLVHVVVLWAWHAPVLYEAALRATALHALEHASLLITATAFWSVVLCHPSLRPLGAAASLLYLFAAAGQSTALGALLTLTAQPSYPIHAGTVGRWGLTPLADQQLAGLIMWVLGGMGYLGAALALLARTLRENRFDVRPVRRTA